MSCADRAFGPADPTRRRLLQAAGGAMYAQQQAAGTQDEQFTDATSDTTGASATDNADDVVEAEIVDDEDRK